MLAKYSANSSRDGIVATRMAARKRPKDRFTVRRRASPGTSPGTLVPDPGAHRSRISVIAYGPDGVDQGKIRSEGPDYLAYAIIDAVIDNFFPVTDQFGELLEQFEDELVVRPPRDAVARIQQAKQDLLVLRRAILPMRDVVNALVRDDVALVRKETRIYLRDCYDHAVQLIDVVGSYRELAAGLMEIYLSGVSNRMNEIMKFLTLVSTVFIPLTFIVGVYGMNFDPSKSPYDI